MVKFDQDFAIFKAEFVEFNLMCYNDLRVQIECGFESILFRERQS